MISVLLPAYRSISLTVLLALLLLPQHSAVAQDPDGYPRLMQGPMLGHVTETSFSVWVRTADPGKVAIAYSRSADFSNEQISKPIVTMGENDKCGTLIVDGLEPSTTYFYRLLVQGDEDKYQKNGPPFSAKTAPPSNSAAKFRIAFGSCARWQAQPNQRIWTALELYQPDLFFWLGDNVYSDSLSPETLPEELRRQRDVPELRRFQACVPQLAIWDDHDFGLNNHDRTNPIKEANLATWKRYWANPAFGTQDTHGVFFKFSYGDVDFFFLDSRYHRSPNSGSDGPNKTMLGKAQLKWLKTGLLNSSAKFKVLASGSTWVADKGPGGDAWSSYQWERDELFSWIMKSQIQGVFLISGDTHTGELNVAPAENNRSYDLFDFVASPLAQQPGNDWLFRDAMRVRLPYNAGENFGLLEFDTTGDTPNVSMRLISALGRDVWQPLQLRSVDLQNGKSVWKSLQSADAANWLQRVTD